MLTKITDQALTPETITGDKIQDGTITNSELADNAVTGAKIQNGEIDYDKLAASIIASQAEAEGGLVSNKLMTPERTKQAIDSGYRTLISEIEADNTTDSIEFANDFSTDYDLFKLEMVDIIPATNNAYLRLQTSSDGITFDSGASDYSFAHASLFTTDSQLFYNRSTGNSFIRLVTESGTGSISSNSGDTYNGTLDFFLPNVATKSLLIKYEADHILQDGTNSVFIRGTANRLANQAVTGFRIFTNGGNIVSGKFKLYGINR